jgi:hypothetical protein
MFRRNFITVVVCALTTSVLAQTTVKVSPALVPATGTFYLMSAGDDGPPLPFDPYAGCAVYSLGDGRYAIDDLAMAAAKESLSPQQTMSADDSGPPSPPGGGVSTNGGGGGHILPLGPSFDTNVDLWISLDYLDLPDQVADLTLHNTTNGYLYQALYKTNLTDPWWQLAAQLVFGSDGESYVPNVPITNNPVMFFRGVQGVGYDKIVADQPGAERPTATNVLGTPAVVEIDLGFPLASDQTAFFRVSGTATQGVDYVLLATTNSINYFSVTNSILIQEGQSLAQLDIYALYTTNLVFDKTLTITLLATNNLVVDYNNSSANVTIGGSYSKQFTVVTNLNSPIGIDYSPTLQSLLASYYYSSNGVPYNFVRLYTNGVSTNLIVTNWTTISGMYDEIKIATAKQTAGGFTNGDAYYGNGNVGGIGWMSASGAIWNTNWLTLSSSHYLRGSLYVDQTGIFNDNLIVVTGDSLDDDSTEEVWKIAANKAASLLATINTEHLEGVITLTNDPVKWGPWAGRILTGDESEEMIYAIDSTGVVSNYDTTTLFPPAIDTEDFDIIPTNQDLYACDPFYGSGSHPGAILKLSRTFFNNYVGSLLITDAGEERPPAKLFIVSWNGTNFVAQGISFWRPDGSAGHFEHVTFAPVNLPSHPQ